MPQKVRHYLGHFLWKEKLSVIMHLNYPLSFLCIYIT